MERNFLELSKLSPEEILEIESSIDMSDIEKELEHVNFQRDPN